MAEKKTTLPATIKHDALPPIAEGRQLSRQEAHDLGQIIKERVKVLTLHAEEQAKSAMAQFERHLATIYKYDQDAVWKDATEKAMEEVKRAQEKIEARCAKLGIPKDLAPELALSWNGRGQMATERRRAELRRVARSECEAMLASAKVSIQRQSLDLRSQVITMSMVTAQARLFIESLAPVEEAMHALDFGKIEEKMLAERKKNGPSSIGFYG